MIYKEVKKLNVSLDRIPLLLSNDPSDVYIYVDAPLLKNQRGRRRNRCPGECACV